MIEIIRDIVDIIIILNNSIVKVLSVIADAISE
jgi:hypothetical protein